MKSKVVFATVLFIACSIICNTATAQQKTQSSDLKGNLRVSSDLSDGTGETHIEYTEDGHRYRIKTKEARIIEIYVADQKIPESEFSKYDPIVKKIMEQIEKDREQARKDRAQAELDRKQADKDRAQAEKDRVQAEKDREQMRRDRELVDRDREEINQMRERADKDREQANKDRAQAEKDRLQADKDRAQAEKDRHQADLDRKQAAVDRARAEEDRKLFEAMIDELVKEKLVENRDAITSLELDDKQLLLNGKELSESLHSRFKQKYLKGKNTRIMYRNSGGSRNFSFD